MDIPTHSELVERIDAFLERHNMAPTRLGRDATGEPDLIPSIRRGRQPNLDTLNRLAGFMAEQDAHLSTADWPIASANNVPEIIGGESLGAAGEADSPSPFPEGSASGLTSSSTCPSCAAPAMDPRPLPSSTGAQDKAEAA